MGLFGYGDQSKDFGQITLFYDDLALVKDKKVIEFQIKSEMASLSIQLEQEEFSTYSIHLMAQNQNKKQLQSVGQSFKDITTSRKILNISMDLLVPDVVYTFVIRKLKYAESTQAELNEIGERFNNPFSLKIELSENDT